MQQSAVNLVSIGPDVLNCRATDQISADVEIGESCSCCGRRAVPALAPCLTQHAGFVPRFDGELLALGDFAKSEHGLVAERPKVNLTN
jgi:hypothetical protein